MISIEIPFILLHPPCHYAIHQISIVPTIPTTILIGEFALFQNQRCNANTWQSDNIISIQACGPWSVLYLKNIRKLLAQNNACCWIFCERSQTDRVFALLSHISHGGMARQTSNSDGATVSENWMRATAHATRSGVLISMQSVARFRHTLCKLATPMTCKPFTYNRVDP